MAAPAGMNPLRSIGTTIPEAAPYAGLIPTIDARMTPIMTLKAVPVKNFRINFFFMIRF